MRSFGLPCRTTVQNIFACVPWGILIYFNMHVIKIGKKIEEKGEKWKKLKHVLSMRI